MRYLQEVWTDLLDSCHIKRNVHKKMVYKVRKLNEPIKRRLLRRPVMKPKAPQLPPVPTQGQPQEQQASQPQPQQLETPPNYQNVQKPEHKITGTKVNPENGYAYEPIEVLVDKEVFKEKKRRWRIFWVVGDFVSVLFNIIVGYYLLDNKIIKVSRDEGLVLFNASILLFGFATNMFILVANLRSSPAYDNLKRGINWFIMEKLMFMIRVNMALAVVCALINILCTNSMWYFSLLQIAFLLTGICQKFVLMFYTKHLYQYS